MELPDNRSKLNFHKVIGMVPIKTNKNIVKFPFEYEQIGKKWYL